MNRKKWITTVIAETRFLVYLKEIVMIRRNIVYEAEVVTPQTKEHNIQRTLQKPHMLF